MATPYDLTIQMNDEDNQMFQPAAAHFMLSATRCYGEWGTVIGISLMLAAGLICLSESDAPYGIVPMLSVGIFGAATGCVACCTSNVIDSNYDTVNPTEAVTFDL